MTDAHRPSDLRVTGSHAEIPQYASIPHISVVSFARALRWHPKGLDSWSLSDWAVALAGEAGELCNVVKKLNRVRDSLVGNKETPEELQAALGEEIADVYIYLDLFARRAGLNLEDVIRKKFNAVSERNGFPERL
jgi:NTP pyrophosphatase (non-canonical NTP hydrolase)